MDEADNSEIKQRPDLISDIETNEKEQNDLIKTEIDEKLKD